jgi:Holliday junction resolvasome RuvABC endonuclease subunit
VALKVLGLDLSLSATGAAIVADGLLAQRWLLKTSAEAEDMDRYEYIARSVIGIVFGQESSAVIDMVALEGVYASRNLAVFGRLTELAAVVKYALHRSQVPYVVLPPAAWRSAVFGPKSKVDKERIRTASALRLNGHLGDLDVERVDLNVLEAALVALAAWRMETGAAPRPVVRKPRRKVAE